MAYHGNSVWPIPAWHPCPMHLAQLAGLGCSLEPQKSSVRRAHGLFFYITVPTIRLRRLDNNWIYYELLWYIEDDSSGHIQDNSSGYLLYELSNLGAAQWHQLIPNSGYTINTPFSEIHCTGCTAALLPWWKVCHRTVGPTTEQNNSNPTIC